MRRILAALLVVIGITAVGVIVAPSAAQRLEDGLHYIVSSPGVTVHTATPANSCPRQSKLACDKIVVAVEGVVVLVLVDAVVGFVTT